MGQLLAVVQELSLARDITDVQRIVRRAARELTSADGATFVLRDGDQCFYVDEDAIAPLWKGSRFPMSACVSGWVMTHQTPVVIDDIYADERIAADVYRPTFVKSLAMVPIRASNPIGAIGNYWADKRRPTKAQLALLQALADSTSIALENTQLFSKLQTEIQERTLALDAAEYELAERKRAEAALTVMESQLRHSQKMEAIGRLSGGIAHEFNNVLSVILTYSSVILGDLKTSDPLREDLQEIQKAGERAAQLTRQLLAFSRQQVLERKSICLSGVVLGVEKMLARVVGESIQLEVRTEKGLHRIFADEGQLEQILMNLLINAKDAMPQGGRITLETANIHLSGDYISSHLGATEGDYAMLAVSDTGTGMDKETQARIFEPFFTTKDKACGTGLGLSTVYGIVRQSQGQIWVYSEPGKGTTFKLYFPKHLEEAERVPQAHLDLTQLTGSETILLVEDDEPVRMAAKGILRRGGYNVLETRNAGEALLTCEKYPARIDLLLTDVVMPMMSGTELAKRLKALRPAMKALCMSGYTDEAVLQHGVIDSGVAFLQKPLTPDRLLTKVRTVLAG